jgi:spore germination cell wall hydrolase CwlJ-like protein
VDFWRQKAARHVLAATFLLCLAPAGAQARPAESGGLTNAFVAKAGSTQASTGRVARLPDLTVAQTRCLSMAIYHEARGEPAEGQNAVGRVILNRVASRYYPDTVCGVVYQNAARLNRCQFSFACDGKTDKAGNLRAWQAAVAMAERLMCRDVCGGMAISADLIRSTHYHATYVKPSWSKKLLRTGQIGSHIFYFTSRR